MKGYLIPFGLILLLVLLVHATEDVEASYPPHDSIHIHNDDMFGPTNGVRGGDGTKEHPFVIEGYNITGPQTHAILIENTSKHVVLRDLELGNTSGSLVGIRLSRVANCTLENVTLLGFETGIELEGCERIVIDRCAFNECNNGTLGDGCVGVAVQNSTFMGFIVGSTWAECGVRWTTMDDTIVEGCIFEKVHLAIKHGNPWGQAGSGNIIRSNRLVRAGMEVHDAKDGLIAYNSFDEYGYIALSLEDCYRYQIEHNFVGGYWHGFDVARGQSINISRNEFQNTNGAIYLGWMQSCTVFCNNISGGHWYGIEVSSENAVVIGNTINETGRHAIRLEEEGNTAYLNNIIGCNWLEYDYPGQALDDGYHYLSNSWDNGVWGNYWDDYRQRYPGASNDGEVWDTPYRLPTTRGFIAMDRYPLVRMFVDDEVPPVARAGPDQTVDEGDSVRFDGSASFDNIGITGYRWQFTYGGRLIQLSGRTGTFTFDLAGTYNVSLTVFDRMGNKDTDLLEVTVIDITPPVADAGYDIICNQYETVTMDGSRSHDASGIINYTWTFKMGGVDFELYGVRPVLGCDHAGSFVVTLTVEDAYGMSATDVLRIIVHDTTPPTAVVPEPFSVEQFETIELNGSWCYDNVGVIAFNWTFYTDAGKVVLEDEISEYAFEQAGAFTITLTVFDAAGLEDEARFTVTVLDAEPPVADAGDDLTVDQFGRAAFDGGGSTDNIDVETFTWTFVYDGEDVTLEGERATFDFEVAGSYEVLLTVADERGNRANDTMVVTVLDKVAPVFEVDEEFNAVAGETVHLVCGNWSDNVGVVEFRWEVNINGTPLVLVGQNVSLRVDEPGEYTVVLTLRDAQGNEASGFSSLHVVEREDGGAITAGHWTWVAIAVVVCAAGAIAFLIWRRHQ